MKLAGRSSLVADGIVNLIVGCLLLLIPLGAATLGVPVPESPFYASLLGAVLVGFGFALLLEAYGAPRGIHGLGLAGAIVINVCGAGALVLLPTVVPPEMPLHGRVLLWSIAIAVMALGMVELAGRSWRQPQ